MRLPTVFSLLAAFAVLAPVTFLSVDPARAQAPAAPSKADPDRPAFSQPNVTIQQRQKSSPDAGRPQNRVDLRVDTNVVLVPTAVNDVLLGRPVAGLEKKHFKITDNGIPQTISSFTMDDAPVAMGLVFDTSSSMGSALAAARRAASLFVASANPGDQFLLVEFDSAPRMTVPLTEDLAHIKYEMTFTQSRGSTALVDGVYMAMSEIKKSPLQRKALILVSDGGENNSRYTVSELRTVLQESDVLIYSVALVGDPSEANPGLMKLIAEQTGGRTYNTTGLQDIASKISVDLRNRYLIGYVPNNYARDGKYHKIEVTLVPPKGLPKLKAYWRKGYFAPTE